MIQRLFGVSLVLGADQRADAERARALRARSCRPRSRDLRARAAAAARAPAAPETSTTLRAEIERLRARAPDLPVDGRLARARSRCPPQLEPLAQSVLAEAVRNARKHAEPDARRRARRRTTTARSSLEVGNDGVRGRPAPGAGMGLRLAALEALQPGGIVEFGEREPGAGACAWRCRLGVPLT